MEIRTEFACFKVFTRLKELRPQRRVLRVNSKVSTNLCTRCFNSFLINLYLALHRWLLMIINFNTVNLTTVVSNRTKSRALLDFL